MQGKRLLLLAGTALAVGFIGPAQGQTHPTLTELTQRAKVIRPSAEELKWQRIPWLTDLGQGQRVAQGERRPILLWVTGDDPLERC
jgi:hypothetical protein